VAPRREDNEDLREQLAVALREHGYEVQTAVDGAEALRRLDAAVEMPAVVLLDLMMPRVTGRQVLGAMRSLARARHIPVVVVTGGQMSDADISAFAVTAVFEKPVAVDRLLAAIDEVCGCR
jgi:DNA-binding response OmpR family regulator